MTILVTITITGTRSQQISWLLMQITLKLLIVKFITPLATIHLFNWLCALTETVFYIRTLWTTGAIYRKEKAWRQHKQLTGSVSVGSFSRNWTTQYASWGWYTLRDFTLCNGNSTLSRNVRCSSFSGSANPFIMLHSNTWNTFNIYTTHTYILSQTLIRQNLP